MDFVFIKSICKRIVGADFTDFVHRNPLNPADRDSGPFQKSAFSNPFYTKRIVSRTI